MRWVYLIPSSTCQSNGMLGFILKKEAVICVYKYITIGSELDNNLIWFLSQLKPPFSCYFSPPPFRNDLKNKHLYFLTSVSLLKTLNMALENEHNSFHCLVAWLKKGNCQLLMHKLFPPMVWTWYCISISFNVMFFWVYKIMQSTAIWFCHRYNAIQGLAIYTKLWC